MENRERHQNVPIKRVPEMVRDADLQSYLLELFTTLAPNILDIEWRLDGAHCSLGFKPPTGACPRDIIVSSNTMIAKRFFQ